MKIAFRSEGGSSIGMGHIMRTLVLARELSKENDVFYVSRFNNKLERKYLAGIQKIVSEGFLVKTIGEESPIDDLGNIEADLLITDSYDVNEEYFNATKNIFSKTAYIDDMNLYSFNVDYLINQNVDGVYFDYRVNNNTKLIIGPQYIMLRDEFRNTMPKYLKKNPTDIMITVGGSDPHHVTELILEFVKGFQCNFHVVIGPTFEKCSLITNYEDKNIRLYYNANMYEIMQKSDIAISACGSTLYELAACGLPTLGLILAENQQGVAKKMDELGIIKNLGWYNEISKELFLKELEDLCNDFSRRREQSVRGREVVDGKGAKRIAEELIKSM